MDKIREVRMEDLEALGHIAYATGFFGESARRFFPDATLFTDLWVRPYLGPAGLGSFIAFAEEAPVGYILGARLSAYRRHLLHALPWLCRRALRGDYPQLWPSLAYLGRLLRYALPHAPTAAYPVQLHINLLPEGRGRGLGQALLHAHLEALRQQGLPGVQLSTTRENAAALRLYERMGFCIWREARSPLWRPWLGRDAVHLVMVKELA
ncbi:GNAT family N-acetyltransferase [Meiothermus ruber]|jgi:ribosomal protein S18 acetylase RimI-like enzyme|uniref:GCN5-related N-acetyltransferase n=2 Tax=Meiothermus ruber (strain ATCC 35948 / DSM 1279 / VKM B-1258 / 21) TaxID=504728 RepID=A0A806CRT6_MEIRD|nr:GNAT family N-acetyltransferase [Meiothermus ruber]ADD27791.1 GCN5-related N-acetyltransferase [Meiothermus ruber DSM 1279]MCL6529985.1 GNAT family N-acetyltransferase [Meiothermus ruber]GAO74721.1 N-acetyltransferase GCN5 [Meiothermus ruber H328]